MNALSDLSSDEIAGRVAAFRDQSSHSLENSAALLDAVAGGRGRVLFADLGNSFVAVQAALTNAPLVYGANCEGLLYLGPEDPVADDRPEPCESHYGPDGISPDIAAKESCLRASTFHPNLAAQPLMAEIVVDALQNANAWPP